MPSQVKCKDKWKVPFSYLGDSGSGAKGPGGKILLNRHINKAMERARPDPSPRSPSRQLTEPPQGRSQWPTYYE